jgi:hypothetical protein
LRHPYGPFQIGILVIYIFGVEYVVTRFPKGVGLKHAQGNNNEGGTPTANTQMNRLKIKTFRRITDRFRGIYRILCLE